MEVITKLIMVFGGAGCAFALILGIVHRFFLYYDEDGVQAIAWFYPWTIWSIEHFNEEKKYRHWLTTFLCTIVGIIDTINSIPAFILILLTEAFRCVFKMIAKGIKYLIFADREEEPKEESDNSINKDIVLAYHTKSGRLINITYNPETNVTFVTKNPLK